MFNRFYLIFSVLLSLSVPALQLNTDSSLVEPLAAVLSNADLTNALGSDLFLNEIVNSGVSEIITGAEFIFLVYTLLTLVFITRYLFNLVRLIRLTKIKGPVISSLQSVYVEKPIKPFSFFKFLFINKDNLEHIKDNQSIILHEIAHAAQFHSLDILVIEFLKCFLWFNPLVWIYQRVISENHEYLADSYAVKSQEDPSLYALNLISSAGKIRPFPFTSGFGYLLIKKRIKMLNQSNKSIMSNISKITLSLLIGLFVISLSAFNFQNSPIRIIEKEILKKVKNTPEILPIEKEQIEKISSKFGMRFHPIYQGKKMHNGIDFIAAEGTLILATASGKIEFSGYSEAFGNHVIIKHDETYETLYAHMSALSVTEGQKINSSEVIGIIGSSGKSTSTHLHYEVLELSLIHI